MPTSLPLRPVALQLPFLYPSLRPLALLPFHRTQPQSNPQHEQTRLASHKTEGRANRAARGAGKRLGLKRAASELVVPGTILFRQKGTRWFPGENVGMGRDHTLFAKEKGYVVYYLDKWRGLGYNGAGRVRAEGNKGRGGMHFKRYVGIVFEKGETLPYPEGSERRRRLGMITRIRSDFGQNSELQTQDVSGLTEAAGTIAAVPKKERETIVPTAARNYQIRESNTSIGRLIEDAEKRVRSFKRGDRWLAWRKRNKRVQAAKKLKAQKKQRKGKAAGKAARSGNTRRA